MTAPAAPVAPVARPGALRRGVPPTAVTAFAVVAGLALGLPIAALVARSLLDGSLTQATGAAAVLDALGLSLRTTAVSLVITVVLGLPVALVLARRQLRGAWLLETLIDLPIVLPPSVAGLALLLLLGRRGLLGAPLDLLGVQLPFTTLAVIIAQVFVSAPFFIRTARTGIAGVDRDLEDAARVDGASEIAVLRTVTLPLAGPALAAGMAMAWARSLGEFGATIMFAGNVAGRTQTLPLLVYDEFQAGNLDPSIAAAVILVLAALGVLVAVRVLRWGRVLDLKGVG